MNSIYALQNFNNYFNRKVKRYDTLENYLQNSDKYEPLSGVNFNPADGVSTTFIINVIDLNPDYLLVVDDAGQIVSRWFVMDANRTRNGQYKLSLQRDVVAEYYKEIIDAPCLVDRAMVGVENPLLYNSEGDNTFNQIKQSEYLLKDETNTNWIVGYIARDTKGSDAGEISSITSGSTNSYESLESLAIKLNDEKNPELGGQFRVAQKLRIETTFGDYAANWFYDCTGDLSGNNISNITYTNTSGVLIFRQNYIGSIPNGTATDDVNQKWSRNFRLNAKALSIAFKESYEAQGISLVDEADVDEIYNLDGKVVYSSTVNKYYRLRVGNKNTLTTSMNLPDSSNTTTASATFALNKLAQGVTNDYGSEFAIVGKPYTATLTYDRIIVSFEEVTIGGIIKTIISDKRQHLIDAPFDMFAIPYTEDNYNLAQQINLKLGQSVYDMQLLPYCPVRKLVTSEGVNTTLGTLDVDYSLISESAGHKTVSYILWATTSSDKFRIRHTIRIPQTNINIKVYSETTFARIVSPNYNGIFEFNPAKNGGVDYFEVSYTYKPYSPYIHINPNFKSLYGTDFDDARGLQCGGDFSIALTSDAWRTYEINNKNYQNIFNTEIKTMDANQELSNISNGISAVLGAGQTGLMAGLLGGAGLGIGAGILSAGAGAVDMVIQNQMYQNNRQAKVDTFNMSLGNIKARPDSLTKVSAYTITNKYFPFVEIYSATDEEKEIYRNKITYYGINIKAVGKISDYIGVPNFSYFKGSLIRLNNIKNDAHMANQIAQELNGGLYF